MITFSEFEKLISAQPIPFSAKPYKYACFGVPCTNITLYSLIDFGDGCVMTTFEKVSKRLVLIGILQPEYRESAMWVEPTSLELFKQEYAEQFPQSANSAIYTAFDVAVKLAKNTIGGYVDDDIDNFRLFMRCGAPMEVALESAFGSLIESK